MPVRAERYGGVAEIPGALGRRLYGGVFVDGGDAARRAVARAFGVRVFQSRYRRLRGYGVAGCVQEMGGVRTHELAQQAAAARGSDTFTADGVHLNETGARWLAEAYAKAIAPLL